MKKSHLLLGIIVLLVSASLVFGHAVTPVRADDSQGSTASPQVTGPTIDTTVTDDTDTTQSSDTTPLDIQSQTDIVTPTPTITIEASNIICDTNAASPHWGNGATITATTATDYVAQSNGHCQLTAGWNFQWSDQSTNPQDISGNLIGDASGFTTFGPTDTTGSTTTTIPFPSTTSQFHVREVIQPGYTPYTFDQTIRSNANSDSAEFYCETDGLNYDDFEYIRTPVAGTTYHCVAFNAPLTPPSGGTQTSSTPPIVIPPVVTQSPTTPPVVIPSGTDQSPSTGGGGGGITSGGGFTSGGGAPAPVGQVLGASTSCGLYLTSFIKLGQNNNSDDVTRLQAFLNQNLGSSLPTTGVYDLTTFTKVKQFQVKYTAEVLDPWISTPGGIDPNGTGYVYKTTQREINNLVCPALNLPLPQLP